MALRRSTVAAWAETAPPAVGLYDHRGMLRFAAAAEADCLAYADLFGLGAEGFSLAPLGLHQARCARAADCSS